MGFSIYRLQTTGDGPEVYDQPERAILSGTGGPIAGYVTSVCRSAGLDEWRLSEREVLALLRPGRDHSETALVFESSSAQDEHITLYRLQRIHGHSSYDSTEMVFHFRALFTNQATPDPTVFRKQFTVTNAESAATIYENLMLSGGLKAGTWKWMEIEQVLNATTLKPH